MQYLFYLFYSCCLLRLSSTFMKRKNISLDITTHYNVLFNATKPPVYLLAKAYEVKQETSKFCLIKFVCALLH